MLKRFRFKRLRAMTWRQRIVYIVLAAAFVAAYKGAAMAAGWLAARDISSTSQSGSTGFALGIVFGVLVMPLISRWYNAAFRRLGGPDRP